MMRIEDFYVRFQNHMMFIAIFNLLVVYGYLGNVWWNGGNLYDVMITGKFFMSMLFSGLIFMFIAAFKENMKKTNAYKNGQHFFDKQAEYEKNNRYMYDKHALEYEKLIADFGDVWEVWCFKKGFESKNPANAIKNGKTVFDLNDSMRSLLK